MKWYRSLKKKDISINPPLLVTIDYHRDLCFNESVRKDLDNFNIDNRSLCDVALFCWNKMNPLNDRHILSAAYMNIIGDIVLLKSIHANNSINNTTLKDKFNNEHKIYEFTDVNKFESYLLSRKDTNVFFDIDLDYFIESEGNFLKRTSWRVFDSKKIKEIINIKRPFIRWILERIEGYTIAMEPKHCGSIYKSSKFLSTIEGQLFTRNGEWKKFLSDDPFN